MSNYVEMWKDLLKGSAGGKHGEGVHKNSLAAGGKARRHSHHVGLGDAHVPGPLRFNVPAAAMKLVSAIIVAVAISMPAIREHFAFEKRRHTARARRTVTNREGQ